MGRWFKFAGLLFLSSLVISACGNAIAPTEVQSDQVQAETSVVEIQAASATPAESDDSRMPEPTQTSDAITDVEPSARATAMPAPTEVVITETAEAGEDNPEAEATQEEVEFPKWFDTSIADVRTGERFKITDQLGKVILIETMAVWCPNCKAQAQQIQELHGLVGQPEALISISLDVDPFEDAQVLSDYQEKNGFDWPFALAPITIAQQFSKEYGEGFLNPISTPILLIDPQGQVYPLRLGFKDVEYLFEVVKPLLPGS